MLNKSASDSSSIKWCEIAITELSLIANKVQITNIDEPYWQLGVNSLIVNMIQQCQFDFISFFFFSEISKK